MLSIYIIVLSRVGYLLRVSLFFSFSLFLNNLSLLQADLVQLEVLRDPVNETHALLFLRRQLRENLLLAILIDRLVDSVGQYLELLFEVEYGLVGLHLSNLFRYAGLECTDLVTTACSFFLFGIC